MREGGSYKRQKNGKLKLLQRTQPAKSKSQQPVASQDATGNSETK